MCAEGHQEFESDTSIRNVSSLSSSKMRFISWFKIVFSRAPRVGGADEEWITVRGSIVGQV